MKWLFPANYSLFIRVQIRQDMYSEFKQGASRIAAAFHQHESVRPWAAYSTVVGPGLYAYIMVPMDEMGELDAVSSMEKVMHDVYGDEGLADLDTFRRSVIDMKVSLLNRLGGSDLLLDDRNTPPSHLFYISLQLKHDAIPAFLSSAKEALSLGGDSTKGWFLYATFAGEHRIHGFVTGDSIAELGKIAGLEEMIVEHLGQEEGAEVLSGLQRSILHTESSILRYLGHYNG